MMRTLSSKWTFYMKVVLPILWIGGFATITVALLSGAGDFHPSSGLPTRESAARVFGAVTLAGAGFLWWACVRLKRVRLDGHVLYISNYRDEISIPVAQVEHVSENRWLNIRPVTIEFRSETAFGQRITFMPKTRWFGFWSAHPVLEEIRAAADAASRGIAPPAG
jgi:hypothetical protein